VKKTILLFVAMIFFPLVTYATSLVDTLDRIYKTTDFPEEKVVVRMEVMTTLPETKGERGEDVLIQAYMLHRKLLSVLTNNHWSASNTLETDVLSVDPIVLEPEHRRNLRSLEDLQFRVYLYACDFPMRKYRGSNIDHFFQRDIFDKAEDCFAYDYGLQGRNYPYQ